jgi:general stress protein 26
MGDSSPMKEVIARSEALRELRKLIHGIEIGMLTTVDSAGHLRSRPMGVQQTESDDELWFFSAEDSGKITEIEHEHQVGVTFSEPARQRYVSVSGLAAVVHDHAKVHELWKPALKIWFSGPDDPRIVLLRVTIEAAEYWDASSSKMVYLLAAAANALTHSGPPDLGRHGRV